MINFIDMAGHSIETLSAYVPGKPIDELKREFGIENVVKLASNENPYGVSNSVKESIIASSLNINRYPPGDAYSLRAALSSKLGVSPSNLIFGAGSNELIDLILHTYLKPGDNVVSPSPSFYVYGSIPQSMGCECIWIKTGSNFKANIADIISSINKRTKVVFLSNPNNPTGTYYSSSELEELLSHIPDNVIVVLDEAYIEYSDAKDLSDTLPLLSKYPFLILLRTFSKAYGLAGLRVGYGIADAVCCDMMNRVRQPFNTNIIAQDAAVAALKDIDWLRYVIDENIKNRNFLYRSLEKLNLEFVPTQTNFILVNVNNGKEMFERLLRHGVIVRYMGDNLRSYIRVSIGTNEECKVFIEKLKLVL